MTVSSEFLVTALIVALVPGTGVIYTVSNGLFGSRRTGALGCTLGIVPHFVAATLGLTALVHTSARVFQVMKLLGVAYLLYLAWGCGAAPVRSPSRRPLRDPDPPSWCGAWS